MSPGGGLKVKGQRSEAHSEEAAVAKGAHRRLGGGARRTRPLFPALRLPRPVPLRAPCGARRALGASGSGGSHGGRARAAPSLPLPSALGPRGLRRSGKMALHFQVSAPGYGPGAPAGGGSSRPRPRAQPLAWERSGAGAEERATLGRGVRSAWRGCSGVPAGGSRGGGAAIPPLRPARGRCSPRESELGGRDGGSKAEGPEDCHWPEAGAGRDAARPGARSLIGGASGLGAGYGCGSVRWLSHSAGLHPTEVY